MLRQRVISAIVILPPILAAIRFGGLWFSLLIGAVALLGLFELDRLAGKGRWHLSLICSALCTILLIYSAHLEGTHVTLLLVGTGIFTLIWVVTRSLVFHTDTRTVFINWGWTLGGVLYLGWVLGFWIILRQSFGWEWTLLALLGTFAIDTSAFFVGRSWGRRSLAPRISPKKTWEGAIGGMFGGLAATVLLAFVFGLIGDSAPGMPPGSPIPLAEILLLGFLIGIVAQLGDLAESIVKRSVGAKDAWQLIPGHGGILDRLDSIVFTGVLVYCYLLSYN